MMLSICSSVSIAQAQYVTGNTLLSKLQSDPMDKAFAYNYLMGVADSESYSLYINSMVSYSAKSKKADGSLKLPYAFFCIPDGVTSKQLGDIVEKYLINNPQNRHQNAMGLSHIALTQVWPCAGNPY